ncbi:MAG: aspartate kinase [Candidatus Fermentibacteraceae bacterium]
MKKLLVAKFGGTCLADRESQRRTAEICGTLRSQCENLVVVVSAMGRSGDPYATDTLLGLLYDRAYPAERDRLMACGEIISALVTASLLRQSGIEAEALTGWEAGITTDDRSGDAMVLSVDTTGMKRVLARGAVAVVAGFQGFSPEGCVTTLGRGGSDTTAVVLAAALSADEVVFFKTVESVYSADPEKVPEARKLDRICTEDLRQMAWQGAKIVNPRAAETSIASGIPIRVRSFATGEVVTSVEPVPSVCANYIVGVASGPPVARMTVSGGPGPYHVFHSRVFGLVADAGVSMDMFSVFGDTAVFTVPLDEWERVAGILESEGLRCLSLAPCSKVSIVGAGMHGLRGVMARFSAALSEAGVEMLQTVDSHATISALVAMTERDTALRALHREFVEK